MSIKYESEFKKKIVRLHLGKGRTLKSIQEEYDYMKESLRLHKELEEAKKESLLLFAFI